ncbi:MAG: peptide chain release factor N(5)-glutamine methyltransferase [Clostridia bacterium]|nr:peptide chain release factor N(5)-glutamine methyltransferase [Clostridia bacterium]
MNNVFLFPALAGNLCIEKNNAVICTVSPKGATEMNSFKLKNQVIPHTNIWFLRGIEYLFFGTYYFFVGLKKSFRILNHNSLNQKSLLKTTSKKDTSKKTKTKAVSKNSNSVSANSVSTNSSNVLFQYNPFIITLILMFIAFFVAIIFLGFLPTHLGFGILNKNYSIFVKKLCIALTKIMIFYLILMLIYLIPAMKNLYKFNTAGNIALNSEIELSASTRDLSMFQTRPFKTVLEKESIKKQDKIKEHRATNYLNFVVFSLLLSYLVISLIGLDISAWLRPFANFLIMIICFSVVYELLFLLDTNWIKHKKYIKFISWLVNSSPSQTELLLARASLCEIKFMMQDYERELIKQNEITASDNVAFSFVYSEIKQKMIENGINDISEVDWLIASYFNLPKYEIKFLTQITKQQQKELLSLLARRIKGEPIAKIFEYTEFYGLKMKVDKNVLTPRQETEILTEIAIKEIKKAERNALKKFKHDVKSTAEKIDKKIDKVTVKSEKDSKKSGKRIAVLDLCTGSGAIAIAIAKNTTAKVFATDISTQALEIAQTNAKKNNAQIEVKQSDLFSNLKKKQFFDFIISNPPYIKTDKIKTLQIEVRDFDPIISLDGGFDGLYFYKKIANESPPFLVENGKIFLEIGKGQGSKVKKVLAENFTNIKILKDYNHIDRFVIAQKKTECKKEYIENISSDDKTSKKPKNKKRLNFFKSKKQAI